MTKKHYLDIEEEFHKKFHKEGKKERKIAQKTDRSKQKISNRNKASSSQKIAENDVKGLVVSIQRELINVYFEDQIYPCTLRGTLKKEKSHNKKLIAIGDIVYFSQEDLAISYIEKRKSLLSRQGVLGKKEQVIAANIDQVFIVSSMVSPPLKPNLIDRYLIAAAKGHLHPIVVVNKIDLIKTKKERQLLKEFVTAYQKVGIEIIQTSTYAKRGLSSLKKAMKDHLSVFSGQSGVGKSSLINAIYHTELKTASVVTATKKGAHATTSAFLIPLKNGGFCIDTPGVKSFGIWDLTKEDIINHFEEIQQIATHCHYPNCTHTCEPQCAVQKALEENIISPLRFASYLSLINSIEKQHTYR